MTTVHLRLPATGNKDIKPVVLRLYVDAFRLNFATREHKLKAFSTLFFHLKKLGNHYRWNVEDIIYDVSGNQRHINEFTFLLEYCIITKDQIGQSLYYIIYFVSSIVFIINSNNFFQFAENENSFVKMFIHFNILISIYIYRH